MCHHRQRLAAVCGLLAMLVVSLSGTSAWALPISPGFDLFETPPGGAVLTLPGLGTVDMMGVPLGPGTSDTIVKRLTGLPAGGLGTIDTEIVALSLISTSPVMVGGVPHDVLVGLDPTMRSLGKLVITSHDDAAMGGTFDSSMAVNVLVRLRAPDGSITATMPHSDIITSTRASWTHDPPRRHPGSGDFYPGPVAHTGPHPFVFPAKAVGIKVPDPILPPLCTPEFPDGYQVAADKHAEWRNDPAQMIIDLQPGSQHCPIDTISVVTNGADEIETFASRLDGMANVSIQGQQFQVPVHMQGPTQTLVHGRAENRTGLFDTEMLSMDLRGDIPTPLGLIPAAIRESPTKASQGKTNVSQVGMGEYHIDSFFDVFTELSLDGGQTWLPSTEAARMRLGRPMIPGDTDGNHIVDVSDVLNTFGPFSGPQGTTQATLVNRYEEDGDTDGDRDTDVGDILTVFGNFGKTQELIMGAAGHTVDHATHANLIYDTTTGDVKIDAAEASGAVVTGFVLKNAAGGLSFTAPGTVVFPFGGILKTDTIIEISQADPATTGFGGVHDLGSIFPTGLDLAGLSAFLTTADYTGMLGSGKFELDLSVVPEPSSFALALLGAVGLLGCVRRRRKPDSRN